IRFAVPKNTKLEIQKDRLSNTEKYIIIFSLPNYHCPVNVQIAPQQVYLHYEDVQIGAALVNPDFQAYTALQKYMI
ncbi:MAG: hypothetical protein KJ882_11935, partial [Proteobacteria bacterium]|nr:hypothetical protein [Pseudomonadota bacterium]